MEAWLIILIVLGGLLLMIALYVIAIYNRLITLRQTLKDSWSGVDVELKRRYDLIPNLVNTVKGYASHERETLERVIQARNAAMANHGSAESQAKDENVLAGALRSVFALAEAYPQLKADTQFSALQAELSNTEDRIAAARRFYNGNVRALNQLVRQFPSNIIAGMFSFETATYFELEDAAMRQNPQVAF